MFKKKTDKFSIHLANISDNLTKSMSYFKDGKYSNVDDLKIFTEKMKKFEKQGDSLVHQVILDLNNVFITPIEREDILALAMNMDDVLDGLEHTAALLDMYSITKLDEYMIQFVTAIHKGVLEIEKAIELLSKNNLPQIRENAIKIKDYESQCDAILRVSIKQLFQNEKDTIRIIQYKDIYEELEEVADCCQSVANTFEAIIMKNA
ncbi:DUF47 domain-containing protein [Lederbergia wuyishanensis]|uniref:Phosphate transport protein (TIGR00153 family) n=1 Tax=Lederbergia wuyishanensis TaxID=1347903 RepID=A0ABU0D7I1_9BACI|nr:DUF47 domain-containing protein [Lederbergia wuyishanensis]MCJ8009037.1 DUF47 domain-containing protein [Lederbergia wuyishanensis]MDQ0344371.1 putative phosphate transport protein (TIGR00153 family) [Lederbergia wuyishanensis]